jgi:hypothetical protein
MRWLATVIGVGVAAAAGPAHASDDPGAGRRPAPPPAVSPARAWLDRVLAEPARVAATMPKPPPVPVKVGWKPRRLASVNVGAPLLALAAGDLDGDRKAELYAVTATDVVAYDVGAKLVERARLALPPELPAIRPRDAVATAYVDTTGARPELRVRASTRARGARYGLDGKALRELGGADDFPVCAGRALALVPGRNHFGTVEAPLYNVRCRDDLVDRNGIPLVVTAELGPAGALTVAIAPRTAAGASAASASASAEGRAPVLVSAVGSAFEVADVDRDGTIDLIAAGAGAPGDRDAIKVLPMTGADPAATKPMFRKGFTGGVVAIAVADVDGDGADEVIGAVRLPGSTKVDLWQLNP